MGDEKVEFALQQWRPSKGLDSDTMGMLNKQNKTPLAALGILSEDDIWALRLSLGPQKLLQTAFGDILGAAPMQGVSSKPQATHTFAQDKELRDLAQSQQSASLALLNTMDGYHCAINVSKFNTRDRMRIFIHYTHASTYLYLLLSFQTAGLFHSQSWLQVLQPGY